MANDRRAHAILTRRPIEFAKTIAPRGSRSRKSNAATCFNRFLPFAVSLHSSYRPLR